MFFLYMCENTQVTAINDSWNKCTIIGKNGRNSLSSKFKSSYTSLTYHLYDRDNKCEISYI